MKKVLLLIGCVLFATTIFAQERGEGGERQKMSTEDRVKKQVEAISEKIELTDEETVGMTAILTEQSEEMKSLMTEGSRPDRDSMLKIKEKYDVKVKALLGEEKYVEYEALQKEQMEKRGERRGGQRGSGTRGSGTRGSGGRGSRN